MQFSLRDRSTLTKTEYIFYHIFFGLIFAIVINKLVQIMVPKAHIFSQFGLACVCMAVTSFVGIAITFINYRRVSGIVLDIICGIGAFTFISLGTYYIYFSIFAMGIAVWYAAVDFWLVIYERRIKSTKALFIRVLRGLRQVRADMALVMGISTVVLLVVLSFFPNKKLEDNYQRNIEALTVAGKEADDESDNQEKNTDNIVKVTAGNKELIVRPTYGDEYMLANNIDKIRMFRTDERFQSLSYEEKCEAIEAAIYCEARYLGLTKIDVVFDENLDSSVLGQYSNIKKTIYINANYVRNEDQLGGTAEEILKTCAHECRHCYQYMMAELYVKASPEQRDMYAFTSLGVDKWIENIFDYKDGNEDYIEYFYEPLEVDARKYSREAVELFYEGIDEIDGPIDMIVNN